MTEPQEDTTLHIDPAVHLQQHEAISREFLRSLVREALLFRPSASRRRREMLNELIRRSIELPGTLPQRVHKANDARLANEIVRVAGQYAPVLQAALDVWLEKRSDLDQAVRRQLRAAGWKADSLAKLQDGPEDELRAEFTRQAHTFVERNPEYGIEIAIAAFACVQLVPWPDEVQEVSQVQDPQGVTQNDGEDLSASQAAQGVASLPGQATSDRSGSLMNARFGSFLAELDALPPSAAEWSDMSTFVTLLQELAFQKSQSLEQEREPLRAALETLKDVPADAAAYFGFDGLALWSEDLCPPEALQSAARRVNDLAENLRLHQELLQTAAPNLQAERQRRQQLDQVEAHIETLYHGLTKLAFGARVDSIVPPRLSESEPADLMHGTQQIAADEELDETVTPTSSPRDVVKASDTRILVSDAQVDASQLTSTEVENHPSTAKLEGGLSLAEPVNDADMVSSSSIAAELDDHTLLAGEPTRVLPPPAALPSAQTETTVTQSRSNSAERLSETAPVPAPELGAADLSAPIAPTSGLHEWADLQWALVKSDDIPAAYWLARAMPGLPIPDWLLAAVQGSRWLDFDGDMFASDLLLIAENQPPSGAGAEAHELLSLAAALRPALIAPYTGLIDWLRTPRLCPAANGVVDAIREFATMGLTLHQEDLLGVTGADERQARLSRLATEVAAWLEQAPRRRTKFHKATRVWLGLLDASGRNKHSLYALLRPVANDDRDAIASVREQLSRWQDRAYVNARIQSSDTTIVGDPRDQLARNVLEAAEFARRWVTEVEHGENLTQRTHWVQEQVAKLRQNVQTSLPEIFETLARLAGSGERLDVASAALTLGRMCRRLEQLLLLPLPSSAPVVFDQTENWRWLTRDSHTLWEALARRLLWLYELELDDDLQLAVSEMEQLPGLLRATLVERRTLRHAVDGWIAKSDFRFWDWLERGVNDPATRERFEQARSVARVELREAKEQAESAIDQALVDGILFDDDSVEPKHVVSAIDPDTVHNVHRAQRALARVRTQVDQARSRRLGDLTSKWNSLEQRVTAASHLTVDPGVIRTFVQSALQRGDTRVVEETLSMLDEALSASGDLQVGWFQPPVLEDTLAAFRAAEGGLEEALQRVRDLRDLADDVHHGRPIGGLNLGSVPGPRRGDAAETLKAWRLLKQRPGNAALDQVRSVLRYLGVTADFDSQRGANKAGGQDWAHWSIPVSLRELEDVPVPQFGSAARGVYNVVCLWERPGVDTIANRFNELRLKLDSVLVLYLGRLTLRQRQDLLRLRDRGLAAAVLDEVLLVFLAREREAFRLPSFLRCALPYSYVNPYTPFQAGDVPPEMFFGRRQMARELQEPAGSCIVYGGRQLGKSALLRHVQRQFHHPERQQYAWIENMKLVYDPNARREGGSLWNIIRERFRQENILPAKAKTGSHAPDAVRLEIREVLMRQTQLRILFMLDEADSFLDAEAAGHFRTVVGLRELMVETGRRFKVVFAGLHNVQRFQGIPDQPLAHFGTPICVGPLEPDAALALVRKPLEMLGFRFEEGAAPLRILSYTNYHPGLIQLFCQALLETYRDRARVGSPPYLIRSIDVERVYLKKEIQDRIKERLDWTLALDPHYQAIAWAMISAQMELRDGYAIEYSAGDLLTLARQHWLRGFEGVSLEKLRGFLDEMIGLGVLAQSGGAYRLRSPNLVRLMGSMSDIMSQLEQLSEMAPPKESDANVLHALLPGPEQRYSPLTYEQERGLNSSRSLVALLSASAALGLNDLSAAIQNLAQFDGSESASVWEDVPLWLTTADDTLRWLESFNRRHATAERLMAAYLPGSTEPDTLAGVLMGAAQFCQRRSRKQRLHFLAIIDPDVTAQWLAIPIADRQRLEEIVHVRAPAPWHAIAVRRRLEAADMLANQSVTRAVMQATGGWPMLLDELFARYRAAGKNTMNDPKPYAREIGRELNEADTTLRLEMAAAMGISASPEALQLFRELASLNDAQIPTDIIPEATTLPAPRLAIAIDFLTRMSWAKQTDDLLVLDPIAIQVLSE